MQMNGDNKKSTSSSDKEAASKEAPSEDVTLPIVITGASLRCAEEAPAEINKVESLYGCQITDASGSRRNAGTSGTDYKFGWRESNPSLSVYIKHLPSDTRYDALFLFRSSDFGTLTSSLASMQVVVQAKNISGQFEDAINSDLSQVTVSSGQIPQAKTSDYNAIREELVNEANNSTPTPPIPE